MKKRVAGIGGVFFRCEEKEKTKDWDFQHLGIDSREYGCHAFLWRELEAGLHGVESLSP